MAAYTLFDISYRVARELAPVFESLATGGSTTTIIDTLRLSNQFGDDYFNLGTAWVLRDAGGAGAAPEKEFARVSDFVSTTGTATIAALSAAVGAGDRYALASARYDLDRIIGAINAALARIKVPTEDITTLTTASGQLEYSLPAGVLDEGIEVWYQGQTGDTDANMWLRLHNWHIAEMGTGTQKLLIFHSQPISGRVLKIVYYLPHAALYASTDKLRENIDINWIVYQAALLLLGDELNHMSTADKALGSRIARLEELAKAWTPASTRQTHKLATFGISTVSLDEDDL